MQTTEPPELVPDGVGYLTMREYNRARWAYELSHPTNSFMVWLETAGNVNFNVEDVRVRTSRGGHVGIPATRLAYLEIQRLSGLLQPWPGVEEAAHDVEGQQILKDLGREVGRAYHQWPDQEKPHKVTAMRCGGCGLLSLVSHPPRFQGDDTLIACTTEGCRYTLNDDGLAWAVEMILKEERERRISPGRNETGNEILDPDAARA